MNTAIFLFADQKRKALNADQQILVEQLCVHPALYWGCEQFLLEVVALSSEDECNSRLSGDVGGGLKDDDNFNGDDNIGTDDGVDVDLMMTRRKHSC